MGKVGKGIKCTVEGCEQPAIRSMSAEKIGMFKFKPSRSRRAYLCEHHYKEYKKQTKKDRMIEKWKLDR